ncbi:MAG: DUF2147 domain-containing protein [Pseudomonadota bacterium]
MRKIALSGMFLLAAAGTASAADPLGEWRDEDGKATIRIVDCNSRMWGIIASEKVTGTIDKNNPDKAKRTRATLGMPILLNMKKDEDEKDRWEGEIYDPIRGKVFSSSIQVKSATSMRVEGCVAMVLCGGQTWTKVEPGASGFTYAPMLAKAPGAAPAPAPTPKSTTTSPFPTPIGTPKATAPKGASAKAGAPADPVTAEICALPEIVSAPAK